GQRSHEHAQPRLDDQRALGDQPAERLAQRRTTHPERGGQVHLVDPRAGREPPVDDHPPYGLRRGLADVRAVRDPDVKHTVYSMSDEPRLSNAPCCSKTRPRRRRRRRRRRRQRKRKRKRRRPLTRNQSTARLRKPIAPAGPPWPPPPPPPQMPM